jgi:hypothetical protein
MADFREIVSPGDAFSQGFEGLLFHQQQQRRQEMLDTVAAQREARLEEADRLDNEIRRQQLQEKVQEIKDREGDKWLTHYEKTAVPGDIPSVEQLQRAKELGVSDIFREDKSKAVAPPPSQTIELPGAVPIPGSTEAPTAVRLAPSPSEAGLKGPQSYPGSAKQQEMVDQREHAKALLDALPEGPEKEGIKFWLATGKEPPAGLLTGGRTKQPELGTFGDYLYTMSNGHPENLTAKQKEDARKKWGEEGRAPQSPINLFTLGADGKPVPAGSVPHGSRMIHPPVSASALSKLTPEQMVVFKDVLKRKEAEAESFFNKYFGEGLDDERRAQIEQEAMAEALKVQKTPGVPGSAPAAPAAKGGVITVHPDQVK